MIKKITYVIYIFFFFINYIFNKITKKDFLTYFKEFIESIGGGSYLPSTWSNTEADPTNAMPGHSNFLPSNSRKGILSFEKFIFP